MKLNDMNQTVDESGPERLQTIVAKAAPDRIARYRIERVLGEGGFGLVYLAYDDQLQRFVAIKVPHPKLIAQTTDAEAYLTEARTVANLDHPHIVPVFDLGSTEQFPCFVVSKYIEGTDLATKLKRSRFTLYEAVELVATVAEALHHAHKQGLVHRDIKPSNILLDKCGNPFLGDFGLALREKDLGKGPRCAGTPAYMSPEQARGEGHRVDGRSDIFSLGVVLYELLTQRRPFRADSLDELLEQITSVEARPPRQIDDAIPKELDRICLKALSKRASERYSTARDMADDLRQFLAGASLAATSVPPGRVNDADVTTPLLTPLPTSGASQRVKIIPKGLRSFDASDADFFLELLPGPRDRDGLPDSIRFWKTRIETTDPDRTFSVGLIYGPSGCGKSSLVRAGLLPRLAKSVTSVYVEATGEDTEVRLLKGLRRLLPDLSHNLGLVESLAALRRGHFLESGQKVLLVLDQFEQWLHARRSEENCALVGALRHCDAGRLQCIVMVRDDFWLAVSRFMQALEIRVVEAENSRLVDLFDLRHARKVLAAFGRAFGALPEGTLNREHEAFLDQAIAGSAQEGKVISVRLALFAEMVKGKPWTTATLKEVGGTEGVGVAFLEETFAASTAPPQHRLHQKAAQAMLRALLPEAVTDIKGHMRSQKQLLTASGYVNRPSDFAELLHILDSELRLITPTDPEGVQGEDRVEREGWRVEGETDDRAKLPSVRGVAACDGVGGEVLSSDQGSAQGGVVRADQPDPTGGGIDPGQHRRGTGEGAHQGIPQPSEHGPRIAHGTGNAPDVGPAGRAAGTAGGGQPLGPERPNQSHAQRPPQGIGAAPEILTTSSPSTHHPPPSTRSSSTRYYQLTHDYLVPSLRDWLTRKQKETRPGRAELMLVDRAAVWNARPENRQLPSLVQWLQICSLTARKNWTPLQRAMMAKAGRHHGMRGLVLIAVLALLAWAGYEGQGRLQAHALRDRLLDADTSDVPAILQDMDACRRWIDPLLRSAYQEAEANHETRKQLHASLALLPANVGEVTYLYGRLLDAQPHEVPVIRDALAPQKDALREKLWTALETPPRGKESQRLRAAAALATFDPQNQRWTTCAPLVVNDLVLENPVYLGQWSETYRPVRQSLLAPLANIYRDHRLERSAERTLATNLLADYAADSPQLLADLLMDADEKQFAVIYPKFKEHGGEGLLVLTGEIDQKLPPELSSSDEAREKLAKRQANAAVALLRMNQPEQVWPLLKHSPDPRVRSYLIHRLSSFGADAVAIIQRLYQEPDITIRRALLLSLGEFSEMDIPAPAHHDLLVRLQQMYRSDTDPGLHAAAEWLLRQWKQEPWLKQVNREWADDSEQRNKRLLDIRQSGQDDRETASPQWYVNEQGQTMVVIPGPREFWMGSPTTEVSRGGKELLHRERINRTFAIAAKPVTIEQFRRFRSRSTSSKPDDEPNPNCPMSGVIWFEAAAYCNWLSEQEGLPRTEWCYEPNADSQYGDGMTLAPNYPERSGYRLPNEAEMEYACRAGALTSRYYGETEELLGKYAWYLSNAQERTWEVGILVPNDLGLFDMHGNVWCWCQDRRYDYGDNTGGSIEQQDGVEVARTQDYRMMRGGSFAHPASILRSASRNSNVSSATFMNVGFRPARTIR